MILENQKIINLLDHTTNQLCKFRTRNWVEINDESQRKYDSSSIKLKASVIRPNLCDYSDAYIIVSRTITITGEGDDDAGKRSDKINKGKNCASFTKCISNINNTKIDHAKDIDVLMPMYNLIEYNDSYSKTSGIFWQYYRDELKDKHNRKDPR